MKSTTHEIGTGTANLSVNMPVDELAVLRAAARRSGMRLGEFIRSIIPSAVDTKTAAQIRHIRASYYGIKQVACATISAGIVLWISFVGGQDMRRPRGSRGISIRREVHA